MKKILTFLFATTALNGVTLAQLSAQSVTQSGNVTPGHAARWITNGVVGDAGTAANGSLTSLGVTNNGGPGICVNSGPITGAYNSICLQTGTSAGGQIVLTNHAGATGGFSFVLNGVAQGFPTVSLPVTAGNYVCFTNTGGTLQDCGTNSINGVVIAADHGVVCDGVTDTTAAINALDGTANITVILPPGVCVVGSARFDSNGVQVVGMGGPAGGVGASGCGTILKRKNSYYLYTFVLAGVGQGVSDLCVDGNGPNNTGEEIFYPEIFLQGSQNAPNTATRVGVFNSYTEISMILVNDTGRISDCVLVGPADTFDPAFPYRGFIGVQGQNSNNRTDVTHCKISNMAGPGASFGSGVFAFNELWSNHHQTFPSSGGQVNPNYDAVIIGNIIRDGGAGATGVEVQGHVTVIGNIVRNNPGFGIYVELAADTAPSMNVTIVGNDIEGNYIGVSASDGRKGIVIGSNKFYGNTNGAVVLGTDSEQFSVTGNSCENGIGFIDSSGKTTNTIQNNQGCGLDSLLTIKNNVVTYTDITTDGQFNATGVAVHATKKLSVGYDVNSDLGFIQAKHDSTAKPLYLNPVGGRVQFNNKIATGATPPTLSSCGTSPGVVGSDTAGQVSMGTGSPTACTITFSAAYTATPFCVVVWQNPPAAHSYTTSNTAITLTQTGTSSNVVNYFCMAESGG